MICLLFDELFYALFLVLIHDLVLVLKFLCVQHIYFYFLLYRLHTSLLRFLIFILSGKNGKSLGESYRLFGYSISVSSMYPILLPPSCYFINFLPNSEVFFLSFLFFYFFCLKSFTGTF